MAPGAHDNGSARAETPGRGGPEMGGHEPGADGTEPGHQVGPGVGTAEAVVFAEGGDEEPEGGRMAGLVVTYAFEVRALG